MGIDFCPTSREACWWWALQPLTGSHSAAKQLAVQATQSLLACDSHRANVRNLQIPSAHSNYTTKNHHLNFLNAISSHNKTMQQTANLKDLHSSRSHVVCTGVPAWKCNMHDQIHTQQQQVLNSSTYWCQSLQQQVLVTPTAGVGHSNSSCIVQSRRPQVCLHHCSSWGPCPSCTCS